MVFDLLGDDAKSIMQKRDMMVWDRKRKRYVKHLGVDITRRKQVRNEAGQRITKKAKAKPGDLYGKWKSLSKKSIQTHGEEGEHLKSKQIGFRKYVHNEKTKEEKQRDELRSLEQIRKRRNEEAKKKARLRKRLARKKRF